MSEDKESRKGLDKYRESLKTWIKDLVDVVVTLSIILVVLRILLGSQTIVPLVVVTSGSMVHHEGDHSWIHWLNERGVSNDTISGMAFGGGFNRGDMMVTIRPNVALGDVIIYDRDFVYGEEGMEPIIHRVIGIVYVNDSQVSRVEGTLDCFDVKDFDKYIRYVEDCRQGKENCNYPGIPESTSYRFYLTKGDANTESDQCAPLVKISIPVNHAQLPAKAWIRLPYIGWLKLILNTFIKIITFQF